MSSWIIQMLIASSLLMLAVLSLRTYVAKRFGAKAAYILWCAPALRMILPPLPESWIGFRPDTVSVTLAKLPATPSLSFPATHSIIDWQNLGLMIWLSGAVAFLTWHSLRYLQFTGAARSSADWLYAENNIEVATSPVIASPVAFGFLNKTVLLPMDFADRYSPVEQRLSLAHELAHHRRHDLPVNFGALVLLTLHWFNPLAHIAHRAFRLDQEAACDQQILVGVSAEERQSYGIALVKSATAGTPLVACATAEASTLKTRLRRIADRADSRPGLWILPPLAIASALVTASIAQPHPARPFPVQRSAAMPPARALAFAPIANRTSAAITVTVPRLLKLEQAERATSAKLAAHAPSSRPNKTIAKQAGPVLAAAYPPDEPPAPAQTLAAATFASACQAAQTQQVFSQDHNGERVVIVACDGAVGTFTTATTEAGLLSARADIEQMELLSIEQRASAIMSVDRALTQLRPTS
jgi:bla regulator protein blaR1